MVMIVIAHLAGGGCATMDPTAADLLGPEQIEKWKVVFGPDTPWSLEDGVYRGHDNWTGYGPVSDDFVLECDFLFDGNGEGGIAIRCDLDAEYPWRQGYELDIDWASDRKHGHIHFPRNPQPYVGQAIFEVGKWHTVRIAAKGDGVTVSLNGKQVLAFQDTDFQTGQLCLEGHETGVAYRNITLEKN
jgi:hypothetical protein